MYEIIVNIDVKSLNPVSIKITIASPVVEVR